MSRHITCRGKHVMHKIHVSFNVYSLDTSIILLTICSASNFKYFLMDHSLYQATQLDQYASIVNTCIHVHVYTRILTCTCTCICARVYLNTNKCHTICQLNMHKESVISDKSVLLTIDTQLGLFKRMHCYLFHQSGSRERSSEW